MMAMLVLMVLILIASQIRISTMTDSRIARNQGTLSNMDLAIESAFLKVYEDLKADAAEDSGGGGGAAAGGFGGGGEGAAPDAGGGGATDSSKDSWATPGRTEINELQLRFYFQDEDSKYNILAMLTEDEDEAEKAHDRVVRILDLCREGTEDDIDRGDAESMADAMLDHMQRRSESMLPRPELLSDDEDDEDLGLPMSLREFVVLPEFHPSHFRDYRDENGDVVHSIGSFLTLWTSLTTVDEASQSGATNPSGTGNNQGTSGSSQTAQDGTSTNTAGFGADQEALRAGIGNAGPSVPDNTAGDGAGATASAADTSAPKININRAPIAVLKALMDDRDVDSRFWDAMIEFRNEEDEEATEDSDEEPPVDEFGNEIIVRQIFNSVNDIAQLDGWENLEPIVQAELRALLDVKSDVFSVFITARRSTADSGDTDFFVDEQAVEEDEQLGLDLLRTVRCVVWRRTGGDEAEIVPLIRWEVLDYVPFEVLDYPDEDR